MNTVEIHYSVAGRDGVARLNTARDPEHICDDVAVSRAMNHARKVLDEPVSVADVRVEGVTEA